MKKSKPKKIPRSIVRIFPNVTQVNDATEGVEVEITDSDNSTGRKKRASECAMARAVCRQFKADGAIIGLSSSYIVKGNKATRFQTPNSVQREIVAFDRHAKFENGTYHLSPINPKRRLGVRTVDKRTSKPSGRKIRKIHETVGVRIMNKKGGSED